MKKYIIATLAAFTIILNSCLSGQSQNIKTNLTPTEFAERIKAQAKTTLIDVRTPDEFSKGHLENAQNIDWRNNDFSNRIETLDKSKPVFVYCLSGGRSASAASAMREAGFKEVYELDGGIMKWRGANLPETTSNTSSKTAGLSRQQFEALLASDKLILVDFYADWCAPCKKMKPYLEEISKDMANKVKVVRINADDNQALCKELQIDALPVLQLYKNKNLTWNNVGFIDKAGVLTQINK
ncbi:thioredoxin [Emticicia aquatilis]|uniref:Thioredoxin n=1 Tax=Emticicia aquatilis TaxID=1537369 RepID=A0A917DJK2_9BACT|nr:thioredoxin domain-containing protein [Emticicia aquatilis]GGD41473.1 thioredoxin [Emticicia aquatilis]